MSTLGYGMYGYNVLNVNGETSDLPVCILADTGTGQSYGSPIYFYSKIDRFGMAVQNGTTISDTCSSIRTPVSGLYEIEFSVDFRNTAASSLVRVAVYCDKTLNWSGGAPAAGGTSSYTAAFGSCTTVASATSSTTLSLKRTIFLEKDCYLSLTATTAFGTVSIIEDAEYSFFSVRCISTENAEKLPNQTF